MISIEGADNSPLCTLFRVPWNPNKSYIAYNEDEEAFQYNGANSWDFGAGELEIYRSLFRHITSSISAHHGFCLSTVRWMS